MSVSGRLGKRVGGAGAVVTDALRSRHWLAERVDHCYSKFRPPQPLISRWS